MEANGRVGEGEIGRVNCFAAAVSLVSVMPDAPEGVRGACRSLGQSDER